MVKRNWMGSGPYWHDGRYASLEEVFEMGLHGLQELLSSTDLKALDSYLLSL
jgi:hypothetical protein